MNKFLTQAARSAYYGDQHLCPLCNSNLKRFNKTAQHNCPLCNSNSMERAALLMILAHYQVEQQLRILVIDCTASLGVLIKSLENIGHQVTLFAYGTEGDKDGNSLNSMLNLHYAKDSFEVIIAPFFLERVYNEKHFCQELQRVLVDDGLLLAAFDLDFNCPKTLEVKAFDKGARFTVFGNQNYFRRYGLDYKERLAQNKFYINNFALKTETLQRCQAFSHLEIVREAVDLVNNCQAMELYLVEQMQNNRQQRKLSDIVLMIIFKLYLGWQFGTKNIVKTLLLRDSYFNAIMVPVYSLILFFFGWIIFCLIPFFGLPLAILFMMAGVTVIVGMLNNENIKPLKKVIMSVITIIVYTLAIGPAIYFFQLSMGYMISSSLHEMKGVKADTPQKESEEQDKMFGISK